MAFELLTRYPRPDAHHIAGQTEQVDVAGGLTAENVAFAVPAQCLRRDMAEANVIDIAHRRCALGQQLRTASTRHLEYPACFPTGVARAQDSRGVYHDDLDSVRHALQGFDLGLILCREVANAFGTPVPRRILVGGLSVITITDGCDGTRVDNPPHATPRTGS